MKLENRRDQCPTILDIFFVRSHNLHQSTLASSIRHSALCFQIPAECAAPALHAKVDRYGEIIHALLGCGHLAVDWVGWRGLRGFCRKNNRMRLRRRWEVLAWVNCLIFVGFAVGVAAGVVFWCRVECER